MVGTEYDPGPKKREELRKKGLDPFNPINQLSLGENILGWIFSIFIIFILIGSCL